MISSLKLKQFTLITGCKHPAADTLCISALNMRERIAGKRARLCSDSAIMQQSPPTLLLKS